jgi:hypothetical protein
VTRYATSMDNAAENHEGATRALAHILSPGVSTGLVISQRGSGANMSVDISTGDGFVPKTNYGPWTWSDTVENVAIGAASGQDRHDAIVAYIDYSVSNPSTSTPNNPGALKFLAVQGTPSGTPVDPSGATIQAAVGSTYPYIILGNVLVKSTDVVVVSARVTNYNLPVALALAYIRAGNLNTIGHLVPNVADDIFQLLTAVQSPTHKTFSGTTNKITAGGSNSTLRDSNSIQMDLERDFIESGKFGYIASGCVWTGDSVGTTLLASMTSGVIKVNGRRLTVSAVTSRAFTASKDTYVDLSDNGDGTALITYTEVTNNASSPTLATNAIRLAVIVTGPSNIAASASINQGQESSVLPIASSVAYAITDSLGNLICNRNSSPGLIGYRQITSTVSTTSGTPVDATGLSSVVNVPAGRRVKITFHSGLVTNSNPGGSVTTMSILCDGVVILTDNAQGYGFNNGGPLTMVAEHTPGAGPHTYKVQYSVGPGGATATISLTAGIAGLLLAEIV